MKWFGFMCVSIKAPLDTKISDMVVEFTAGIRGDKDNLMEAITRWLPRFQEEPSFTKRVANDDSFRFREQQVVSSAGDAAWLFEGPPERSSGMGYRVG